MFCGWDHIRATNTLEILKESGISFFIFAFMDMLAVVIPPSILQDMMSQNLYRHLYLGSVARKFVNVILEFFEEIIPFFVYLVETKW